jgi:hypothetical protein
MRVVVRRDDRYETTMKENNVDEWSNDDIVLWLGRRKNKDAIGWWRE